MNEENGLWLIVEVTELSHKSKVGFQSDDKLGVIASELDGPLHAIAEVFIEVSHFVWTNL